MKLKNKVIAVGVLVCLVAGSMAMSQTSVMNVIKPQELIDELTHDAIHIWYTDDALTDYLNSAVLSYNEEKNIRVETKLVPGLEYLEAINEASLSDDEETPDLFIVSNDSLEKAYLAGLATEITDPYGICTVEQHPETALNAVTYDNKKVAYPFYFETSVLVYNETYLEQIARDKVEAEMGQSEGEALAEEAVPAEVDTNATSDNVSDAEENDADAETSESEEGTTQSDITELQTVEIPDVFAESDDDVKDASMELVDIMVPSSIVDILNFADSYDAPADVENIFQWDVSDIFYNYFFMGNYLNVGGDAGDNAGSIDIYNTGTVASLKVYQELSQFFSIDVEGTNYDSVVQNFIDGKTIFTMATSDILGKIAEARLNGQFAYDYGVAVIPDINDTLETKGMSVTDAVVVNGYSEKKELANDFASYLTFDKADELYTRAHKIATKKTVEYDNPSIPVFLEVYENTTSVPKLIETSNFWLLLENCFTKVWAGADPNAEVKALSEQIKTQLTGEPVVEEAIETPEVELLTTDEVDPDESD